jgi:hypothetical protein
VTCAAYTDELTHVAEETLASLSAVDCAEIDAHRARLRQWPWPAASNGIRRYRADRPGLRPGLEGLFWSRTPRLLVFHAIDPDGCRVLIAAIVPEQHLDRS